MRSAHMGLGLGAVMLVALLASSCMDFSQEHYCREHPETCEMRMERLWPDWSPPQGGSRVTLLGSGFEPDTQVEVDGIPVASLMEVSSNVLRFETPPSSEGLKDIVLRSRTQTVTLPRVLRYGPPPPDVLESITPSTGTYQGGTRVTLSIRNLTAPFSVMLGGQPLREMRISPTPLDPGHATVTGITPPGAEGPQDVVIVTSGGSAVLAAAYTYTVKWAEANQGLSGADVLSLAVDPVDASFLLAGTRNNGLYRSTNQGHTWSRVSTIPSTESVFALIVAPGSRTVHAATSRGYFRSTDAGETWTSLAPESYYPDPYEEYVALALEPDGTLYIANEDTRYPEGSHDIYRLPPGGQQWVPQVHRFAGGRIRALASSGAFRYAATSRGLVRFDKEESQWLHLGPPTETLDAHALVVIPGTPDVIYVGGAQGLYRIDQDSPSGRLLYSGSTVYSVAVEAAKPGTLYLGTSEGLQVSTDAGATWSAVAGALTVKHQAVVRGPDGAVYAGSETGVFVREEGRPLELRNTGLSSMRVAGLAVDATRPEHVYALLPGRLFRSTDGGRSWLSIPATDVSTPRQVRADPVREGGVYVASDSGLYRSLDGGVTWALVGPLRRVLHLAIAPTAPQTLYVSAEDGVWRSDDGGETWRSFGAGLPPGAPPTTLAVSATRPDLLHAFVGRSPYQYRPEAAQWQLATGGLSTYDQSEPLALVEDPGNDTTYALFEGALYRRPNAGATWEGVSRPPELYGYGALRVVPDGDASMLLLGGRKGALYRAAADGRADSISWRSISTELSSSMIRELASAPSNPDVIYVGTEDRGVWRTTVGGNPNP